MAQYDGRDQDHLDSGEGFLPDGTKPLHEPMLTYHQRLDHTRTISQEVLMNVIQTYNNSSNAFTDDNENLPRPLNS